MGQHGWRPVSITNRSIMPSRCHSVTSSVYLSVRLSIRVKNPKKPAGDVSRVQMKPNQNTSKKWSHRNVRSAGIHTRVFSVLIQSGLMQRLWRERFQRNPAPSNPDGVKANQTKMKAEEIGPKEIVGKRGQKEQHMKIIRSALREWKKCHMGWGGPLKRWTLRSK